MKQPSPKADKDDGKMTFCLPAAGAKLSKEQRENLLTLLANCPDDDSADANAPAEENSTV